MDYFKLSDNTIIPKTVYNTAINYINRYLDNMNKIYKRKIKFSNPIHVYASLKYNEDIKHFSVLESQKWVIEKFKISESIIGKTSQGKRIRYVNYKEFLSSEYWQKVKLLVIKRDGYKCVKCKSTTELLPHHLTYKNHFNELNHLEDLVTFCKYCHDTEHHIKEKNDIESHFKSI